MTKIEELAATVREGLEPLATGTLMDRKVFSETAAALDALVAECEAWKETARRESEGWQLAVDRGRELEEIRRERDALARAVGAGRDDLAREVAVQYDRAEAAQRERDELFKSANEGWQAHADEEARAQRYEAALREIMAAVSPREDQRVYVIARAALAEDVQ